jgi:hypothetical protein
MYGARHATAYYEENKDQYKCSYAKLAPKPIVSIDRTNLYIYFDLMTSALHHSHSYSLGGKQFDEATGYIRPQAAAVEGLIEAWSAAEPEDKNFILHNIIFLISYACLRVIYSQEAASEDKYIEENLAVINLIPTIKEKLGLHTYYQAIESKAENIRNWSVSLVKHLLFLEDKSQEDKRRLVNIHNHIDEIVIALLQQEELPSVIFTACDNVVSATEQANCCNGTNYLETQYITSTRCDYDEEKAKRYKIAAYITGIVSFTALVASLFVTSMPWLLPVAAVLFGFFALCCTIPVAQNTDPHIDHEDKSFVARVGQTIINSNILGNSIRSS